MAAGVGGGSCSRVGSSLGMRKLRREDSCCASCCMSQQQATPTHTGCRLLPHAQVQAAATSQPQAAAAGPHHTALPPARRSHLQFSLLSLLQASRLLPAMPQDEERGTQLAPARQPTGDLEQSKGRSLSLQHWSVGLQGDSAHLCGGKGQAGGEQVNSAPQGWCWHERASLRARRGRRRPCTLPRTGLRACTSG